MELDQRILPGRVSFNPGHDNFLILKCFLCKNSCTLNRSARMDLNAIEPHREAQNEHNLACLGVLGSSRGRVHVRVGELAPHSLSARLRPLPRLALRSRGLSNASLCCARLIPRSLLRARTTTMSYEYGVCMALDRSGLVVVRRKIKGKGSDSCQHL